MKRRSALAAMFAALAGCGGGGSEAPAPDAAAQSPAPTPTPAPARYAPDEIVVVQSSAQVDIFMKGSNPASNRYMRYRLQCVPNAAISSDVWRWHEVWEAERTGTYSFTNVLRVCDTGEVETAIRQAGKSDYMGGMNHGDEEMSSASMLIDGAPVALGGGAGSFRCQRLEFVQASDLYEADTVPAKSNRIARASKRWVFEASAAELLQRIGWDAAITLQTCYLTMLPLLRTSGGVQVSDTGFRSPLFAPEDISAAGFAPIYSTSSILKATGPNGHSAEVEILQGWDKPNRSALISPSPVFNKFYFDFTGPGYVTTVGEEMAARARIRLDTTN